MSLAHPHPTPPPDASGVASGPAYLLFSAGVAGMATMAMEITAARLLAPYFGTTLLVWTNIIGVVLIALSAGYYVGGRQADRNPNPRRLYTLILAAGSIGILIPWVARPVARILTLDALLAQSGSVFIFVSSLLVTLALFAVPLFLLGMVSPLAIKLHAHHTPHVGASAGSVFAISTVGSVIGTFLPTLVLIPAFGTNATIVMAGAALVATACGGLLRASSSRVIALVLLAAVIAAADRVGIRASATTLYEDESIYHYIRVEEDAAGTRSLLFNEGLGVQSYLPAHGIFTGTLYYDYYAVLPLFFERTRPLRVLILGLGGGTISRQLSLLYGSRLQIDGVEIDKKVIDIGYRYFDLAQPPLTVHRADAIPYLRYTSQTYDLIIIDAYQNQFYIPWVMTTREFWALAESRLTPDGIIAMNVAAHPSTTLLRAIANTQSAIFTTVHAVHTQYNARNTMLLASNRAPEEMRGHDEPPTDEIRRIADMVTAHMSLLPHDPSARILTDDKAPVEFLTDRSFLMAR